MEEHIGMSLGDIVKQKPQITYNNTRTYPNGSKAPDGIEIRFGSARPTSEVRDMLKAHGYKFSEKQTMWYAFDNIKSRELAKQFEELDVDVDTTQYEKRNFWVRVKSLEEFEKLSERTEFYVNGDEPKNFYSKSFLKRAYPAIHSLIKDHVLSYRRYYNKVVDEGKGEPRQQPEQQEDNIEIAEKLLSVAKGMQKKIDAKLNPAIGRQRPTQRRARIAQSMREEGYKLQEQQALLMALSDAHRSSTIKDFQLLSSIRTIADVETLTSYIYAKKHNQNVVELYNRFQDRLKRININSAFEWDIANDQRQWLLQSAGYTTQSQENDTERKIRELEMRIMGNFPIGFFPTPPDLITKLLDLAQIQPTDHILEPSAGKGDILDVVKNNYTYSVIHAVENDAILRQVLELKGYSLVGFNFLSYEKEKYDKIIMNPPFENGQDIDHVSHAYKLLKPGGRVVAIMSEGVFFRQFKKDKAFRKFLEERNAYISEPIKEAFKKAFNTTGVTVRIVAIDHQENRLPIASSSPQSQSQTQLPGESDEEIELLELEAEAELELLKLRVEVERRKQKSVNGLNGIDEGKLERFRQQALDMQDRWDVLDFK